MALLKSLHYLAAAGADQILSHAFVGNCVRLKPSATRLLLKENQYGAEREQ